jgi:hypothetical protein
MRELLTFLSEDCCQGSPELCQPKSACGPRKKMAVRR